MKLRRGKRLAPRKDKGLVAALKKAETLTNLAKFGGVSVASASRWDRIPGKRVPAIAKKTGLSRRMLRPDLF